MNAHSYDLVAYIARLQPLLKEHVAQIRSALTLAPVCLVVITGAWAARTPRHPLTEDERAQLLWNALNDAERQRVHLVAARTSYDTQRWSDAILAQATRVAPQGQRYAVLYEHGDRFPELPWAERLPEGAAPQTAPSLASLMMAHDPHAALRQMTEQLNAASIASLTPWLDTPEFGELVRECRALHGMREEWAQAPYPPVFVTVDLVVTWQGQVLLIRRGREPGKGLFALPGGFIEVEETLFASALRELVEETGLRLEPQESQQWLRSSAIFDAPGRSQRGRVITHAYHFALDDAARPDVCAGDDAADAWWLPLDQLDQNEDRFHDDHFLILDHFLHMAGPDALPLQLSSHRP